MINKLFNALDIPAGYPILVHVRLRGLQKRTEKSYSDLSDELIHRLLDLKPSHLLIPAFTIYSFMATRIYHVQFSHSEVGRFSEEIRKKQYKRTPDPMYSVLDILDSLPGGFDYTTTLGPGSLMQYLIDSDAIVINVDMPGFYATPVHAVEQNNKVPYRFEKEFPGRLQVTDDSWDEITYRTYVREIDPYGSGSFPPYNQKRRLHYLREKNAIDEAHNGEITIAWSNLKRFCSAIDTALKADPNFLVDPQSSASDKF